LATHTDTPPEYVSEWQVFCMLASANRQSLDLTDYTSVVPAGGSAYILQNDHLSVQHVACYIHSTEAVERSKNPTAIPN